MELMSVIREIYPPEETYLSSQPAYCSNPLGISVECKVPICGYTSKTIPYVTAENTIRCCSQASYLLAGYAIQQGLLPPIDVTLEEFAQAAAEFRFYYRQEHIIHHKRLPRGSGFRLQLELAEIKMLRGFALLTFGIPKDAISGWVQFVYELH